MGLYLYFFFLKDFEFPGIEMVSKKESGTKMNVPRRVLPLISRILQRRLCLEIGGHREYTLGRRSLQTMTAFTGRRHLDSSLRATQEVTDT